MVIIVKGPFNVTHTQTKVCPDMICFQNAPPEELDGAVKVKHDPLVHHISDHLTRNHPKLLSDCAEKQWPCPLTLSLFNIYKKIQTEYHNQKGKSHLTQKKQEIKEEKKVRNTLYMQQLKSNNMLLLRPYGNHWQEH